MFAYCSHTNCRVCIFTNKTEFDCRLINNRISAHVFTSTAIDYIYPKLITRYIDSSIDKLVNRSSILSFNIEERSPELNYKQFTYDPKTISQQVTVGSFVRENYVYFIGSSIQIIDHMDDIDPLAYADTTNQIVVKITRVRDTDGSENFSSRIDITLDCRNELIVQIVAVSQVYYDSTKDEIYFTIHMVNGAYQICKFNMHFVSSRMDEFADLCVNAATSGSKSDCKNLTESKFPEYCYTLARNNSDGAWKACSNFETPEKGGNDRAGWIEHFKPFWQPPLFSAFSYEADSKSTEKFSYINWKISDAQSKSDFHRILQISSTIGSSRRVAIFKNYICYVDRRTVKIVPISCDALYKICESLTSEKPPIPPGCVVCPKELKEIATYEDDNKVINECPAFPKDNNLTTSSPIQLAEPSTTLPSTKQPHETKITSSPIQLAEPSTNIPSMKQKNETETNWLMISTLAVVTTLLVLVIGLTVREQRQTSRQNNYVTDRPKELGQSSRPLLTNTTKVDYTSTPKMLIPANTFYSSRIKCDYVNLFENLDYTIKIDISRLGFEEMIGEGNFGVVLSGTYTSPDGDILKVACKMLRDGETGVRSFFDEGLTMMKFHHPRVIAFIGITLANGTDPIIVTKFMPNGNMLNYLRNNTISGDQIQDFSMQIAEGMEYLHSKKFIHRDLAARNCMLDYNMQIKIGDFGLARQCNDQNMYLSCNYPDMPFAWASIEALECWTFTLKGDIWSYGVVLWEIMTKGEKPFSGYSPSGLLVFLKQGKRLERPFDCPEEFYNSIMMPCWDVDMNERPSFSELIELLKQFSASTNRLQPYANFK